MINSQFNNYLIYAIALNFIFAGFMNLFRLVYKYPEILYPMLLMNFFIFVLIFLLGIFCAKFFLKDTIFLVLLFRSVFFSSYQIIQISYVAKLSNIKFKKVAFMSTGSISILTFLFYYFNFLSIYNFLCIEASVYAILTVNGSISIWHDRKKMIDVNLSEKLKTTNAAGLFFSGLLGAVKMNLLFFILSTTGSNDTKLIYFAKYLLDFFHNFSSNILIKLYPRLILEKVDFKLFKMYVINIGIRIFYVSILLLATITLIGFSSFSNNLFIYIYIVDFMFITSLFTLVNYKVFSNLENYFLFNIDIIRVFILLTAATVLIKYSPFEIIYINQIGNLFVFMAFLFKINTWSKS